MDTYRHLVVNQGRENEWKCWKLKENETDLKQTPTEKRTKASIITVLEGKPNVL